MSDEYRPREHDHLVEPMFGGLGVERRSPSEPVCERPVGIWRRFWRALVRFFRA